MKPHTPEQHDGLAKIVGNNTLGRQRYALGDYSISFDVLPTEGAPYPLAVACAYVPRTPVEEIVIGVGDDVPEKLRGLWALHEFLDFTKRGHGAPNRCRNTEAEIINLLEDSGQHKLAIEYANHRNFVGKFWRNTAKFMQTDIEAHGKASQYDAADVTGCEQAIAAIGLWQVCASANPYILSTLGYAEDDRVARQP